MDKSGWLQGCGHSGRRLPQILISDGQNQNLGRLLLLYCHVALPEGDSASASSRLARGCHDNRQTDANETPSPQMLNGCRVFDWLLRYRLDPSFRPPMLSSRLFCDGKLQQSAICMAKRGLLATLTGCRYPALRRMQMLHMAASETHGRPPVQPSSAVQSPVAVARPLDVPFPLAGDVYRGMSHRRQSILHYANVE